MATVRSLLKNRSLLILAASESVSNTGNWITMMAVFAILVFKGGGGVVESSGIFLAGMIPTLLVSPIAGWLCDRVDRRTLMIGSELGSGLFAAGLIFATQLWLIYALIALEAATSALMTPARQSTIPALVERDELTRANALLQQIAGTIKIAAPIGAGALLAIMNPHAAIVLDVASFALSALILSRLPKLPPRRAAAVHVEASEQARAAAAGAGSTAPRARERGRSGGALEALKSSTALRVVFLAAFWNIMVIIGIDVLAAVYLRDALGAGSTLFGSIVGLVGLGSVASSVLLLRARKGARIWNHVVLGIVLLACIPAALAGAGSMPAGDARILLVLVGSLVGGMGNGLLVVQGGTLLQLLAPPEALGRISGLYQSTAVAGQLVGIVIVPLIVPALLPAMLYFAACAVLLVVLAAATFALFRGARLGEAAAARVRAEEVGSAARRVESEAALVHTAAD